MKGLGSRTTPDQDASSSSVVMKEDTLIVNGSQELVQLVSMTTPTVCTIQEPHPGDHDEDYDQLWFSCPPTKGGVVIEVFKSCADGTCKCVHQIGGMAAQLQPCRFACYLFNTASQEGCIDWELFEGIVDGFDIVDTPPTGYDCMNYSSITSDPACHVMEKSIREDLKEGRISEATSKPVCVHALGAVPKSNGGYRTITDCSRPESYRAIVHTVITCRRGVDYIETIHYALEKFPVNTAFLTGCVEQITCKPTWLKLGSHPADLVNTFTGTISTGFKNFNNNSPFCWWTGEP